MAACQLDRSQYDLGPDGNSGGLKPEVKLVEACFVFVEMVLKAFGEKQMHGFLRQTVRPHPVPNQMLGAVHECPCLLLRPQHLDTSANGAHESHNRRTTPEAQANPAV